jgi:hypothetical protein
MAADRRVAADGRGAGGTAFMSQDAVEELLDRYMNDPLFRAKMQIDPRMAVAECGLELTLEEQQSLHQFDWSLPDAQLQERLSK